MRRKIELFSAKNPNPIISVAIDGTVLYSNEAGEPLLHVWGVNTGKKLPPDLLDFAQKVISQNLPEKIEVKVGKRIYLVEFHPVPEEESVNIYGLILVTRKK